MQHGCATITNVYLFFLILQKIIYNLFYIHDFYYFETTAHYFSNILQLIAINPLLTYLSNKLKHRLYFI